MKHIEDIIILQTNSDNKQLIFETRYLVGLNFTFDVDVVSGDFSGKSHFCIHKDNLIHIINDLTNIHLNVKGTSRLSDTDSDGYIEFSMDSLGALRVYGQIGGSHEKQLLRFEFVTDQTALPKFISNLTSLCNYED